MSGAGGQGCAGNIGVGDMELLEVGVAITGGVKFDPEVELPSRVLPCCDPGS